MSDVNSEVAELVSAIRSNLLVLEGVGFWVPRESKDQYDDVLSEIKSHVDCIQSLVATQAATEPTPVTLESIEAVVKRHVLAVMDACKGVKSQAAKILGIERSTLDRKLMSYVKQEG